MKILATSDLHGNLPSIEHSFDLLFICGDLCPGKSQLSWLFTVFAEWVKALPFKDNFSKIILVPGNHDFVLDSISLSEIEDLNSKVGNRIVFLRHDIYEHEFAVSDGVDSLKIFGTPYCSLFGNWAFMVDDDTLDRKFSQIPNDVDILLSHDSPDTNGLGFITEGRYKTDTTGNKVLAKHIKRVKPKLFLSGHFHSGNHNLEEVNGTLMANVSYVNEFYKPTHSVLELDYDEEHREFIR